MRALHSIVGDKDHLIIPMIRILLYLCLRLDILSMCQSCCTHGSPHIQHQIATALAGVIDNPSATLSLPECRHALAHQQEAWDNYKPQFTMTSKCLVFLTSYRMVSTSSYTTLTSIIILAIAFHHSLSKVWMDHHPISTLYQNSFTVSLS